MKRLWLGALMSAMSTAVFAGVSVGNDAFQFDFADDDGGFALLGISNKLTQTYYALDEVNEYGHLFSIDLRYAADRMDPKGDYTLKDTSEFRSKRATITDDGVEFAFLGGDLWPEREVIDVYVKVKIEKGLGRSHWTLEYDNRSKLRIGVQTRFPQINRPLKDGEGDILMPWSNHGLRLMRNHSAADTKHHESLCNGSYLGYRPMVTAFMKKGGGIYIAAEDPEARIKELTYKGHKPYFTTALELQSAPEGRNGPKYPVTITTFKGDWWQVARIYREWALKQEWAAKGRLLDRQDYPRRLCEIPYWVNQHASGWRLDENMREVRKVFPDYRIGLHWHKWHRPEHCCDYPDYFPARKGVVENVQNLKKLNIEANVYLDSQLWTEGIGDWSNAVKWATMNFNGKDFNWEGWMKVRNAVMCPATEFWQKEVERFSFRVFDELKSDTIYHDQTAAAPAVTCYNPNHGHAIGGGNWWYEGYKKMFAPMKAHTTKVGGVITTEGSGEAYMAYIDGFLTVTDLTDEDVPFYNAVYSGYAYYYGSPQSIHNTDESFWAVQTREFLWGNAIGWYSDPLAGNEAKRQTVRRISAARMQFKDYFSYGQLVDEMRPLNKMEKIRFGFRFRAKQDRGIYLPKVNGNWWKSGVSGKMGLCAANLTGEEQEVRFQLPAGVDDMAATSIKGEKLPVLKVEGGVATFRIAPYALVFIEEK